MSKRTNHDAGFKARVVLQSVKGEQAVSELAAGYGVHPATIHQWKMALLEGHSYFGKSTHLLRARSWRFDRLKYGLWIAAG